MMQTNRAPTIGAALAPPLRVQPDMPALWKNLRTDFDSAASLVVAEHENDGQAIDLPVLDLATWGIVPVEGQFALAPLGRHYSPKLLRANAFAQLMTRLGAPAEFVRDRLPAPLQLATTNWLLASSEHSSSTLLRLRGPHVSAVVSERYCPLDAELLLDCVRSALVQQDALSQVQVTSVATGLVDAVRLVFPSEERAIKVGDVSALGLDISSSSFGRSALTVRGILWRLKCTNGLRVAESRGSFSFRHVGDLQRMRAGIAEAFPSVLAAARGTMDRWRASVNVMVEDVAALIDGLRDLTAGELKAVQQHVQQEVGASRLPERAPLYDVLNGVTAARPGLCTSASAGSRRYRRRAPHPTHAGRGNMNRDILCRPFPPEAIKTRPGQHGKSLAYVDVAAVITRLNQGFDSWSFEIVQHQVLEDEVLVVARLCADGVTKMSFGGSSLTRDRDGRPVSIADDAKAAGSDALKKAASLFGVVLEMYGGAQAVPASPLEPETRPAPRVEDRLTSRQLAALQSAARRRGWSTTHLTALVDQRFRKNDAATLTRSEASTLISELTANGH